MILTGDNEKLKISTNLITENYISQGYISDVENFKYIEKINSSNYINGMLRENYNYLIKLEEIILKKKNPHLKK